IVKNHRLSHPPGVVFAAENREPLRAVFRVPLHKFQPLFLFGKRRRSHVDSEHRAAPKILADALVDYLFADTTAAWIVAARPHRQFLILEFTPNSDDLHAL